MSFPKLMWQVMPILIVLFNISSFQAQVGINTDNPNPGALLDINSSNKGFLMTRVELTSTASYAPITPNASPTTGILVYNTANTGTGSTAVTPGFYYWSGNEWRRLFNQGYTINYTQTSEVIGSTGYSTLTGLDSGYITVPFTGTYQIMVSGYYAAGTPTNTSFTGATQGSITLYVQNSAGAGILLDEKYVASASRVINGSPLYHQAENVKIIRNIDLEAGQTYRFRVLGREWQSQNVGNGTFGKDTIGYLGSLGINTAQRGEMTITLIRQN